MKTTRKILPAIAMLVVSAVMLTTASFAWLAMNDTVDAKGMTANVRSDSIYLLIGAVTEEGQELNAESIQNSPSTSATGTPLDVDNNDTPDDAEDDTRPTTVLPVDVDLTKATTGAAMKTAANWYYGSGASASDGTLTGGKQYLSSFLEYVVRYKYYVTMEAGSPSKDNLKVVDLKITDSNTGDTITDLAPVTVIVACGDQYEKFTYAQYTEAVAGGKPGAAGTVDLTGTAQVTDAAALEICVYIYYDGNNAAVTTNNIANLAGVNVEFSLQAN